MISKKQYIRKGIRLYLSYCKATNKTINFRDLKNFKKQLEIDYNMNKVFYALKSETAQNSVVLSFTYLRNRYGQSKGHVIPLKGALPKI